ncbi:class IV lanthionine synthetase LanL [Kitasatospora sp. NPDC051853]|uniref:class IV lanthionine synthetase LanL n=1 Tax=Kitasatospora sp. NPDC051853 TaxID=3364058 RepID=UPI0037A2856C
MAGSTAGRRRSSDDTWSYLLDRRMPAVDHGWKLHVSARPGDLDAVTELILPVLLRHVCHAKWAKDQETLRELNSGVRSAGSVGKAVTVYPAPGTVLDLADELVSVLRGREGPQVVSDRRVDPHSPVYYRYGPFTGEYRTGRNGRLESVMTGPDGRVFDGLATGTYRCPPWAEDPFEQRAGKRRRPDGGSGFGGGRYRVTGGIARKAQGNVYRAEDLTTGREVVVKQARAFVGEEESGTDARDRLRNEHAVLTALDGVAGVPRALDYFRHRTDEYLVTSSCGDRDLRREVQRNGPRQADGTAGLAAELLRILDGVHGRGVVVRDLKPDNVVLDARGRCHVVDFGISSRDGMGPDGGTPGYGAPVRRSEGAAADYYALGMTLGFAATGLDPVIVGPDPAVGRERTLDGLAWALPGEEHRWIRSVIGELTSDEPAERAAGAERLRKGLRGGPSRAVARQRVEGGLLEEIVEHTAAYCAAEALRIADPVLSTRASVPTPVDVYGGSAGLGLELLRHRHRSGVREAVGALAEWTGRQAARRELSPSFYSGRTGVELFLAEARRAWNADGPLRGRGALLICGSAAGRESEGGSPATEGTSTSCTCCRTPARSSPRPRHHALPAHGVDGGLPEADLIEGVAGIGLAHLLLDRLSPAAGHRDAADACARMLAAGEARLTPAAPRPGDAALRQGLAHGDAGIALFLLEYAHATGDAEAAHRARRACADLAAATPAVIAAATAPGATRRYGSWCRGLAGIGTVLVRAADRLGEPEHLALARHAARTCIALAPRMPLVNQCCGLAGVGELLVDVATATGDQEYWDAAGTVAAIVLSRSGGPAERPVFPDAGLTRPSATWAGGSAGVLGFLRRLHERGGPRLGLPG